jgi:hypothetical protein
MSAAEALRAAQAAGVTIKVDGDVLVLAAPARPSDDVLEALRHQKDEIVAVLRPSSSSSTPTSKSPRLGLACCECGKPINEPLPTSWGGLPCHRECGEAAWAPRVARTHEAGGGR